MSRKRPNYKVVLHYTPESMQRAKSVITENYVKMVEQILQNSSLPQKMQIKAIEDLMEYYKSRENSQQK